MDISGGFLFRDAPPLLVLSKSVDVQVDDVSVMVLSIYLENPQFCPFPAAVPASVESGSPNENDEVVVGIVQ